MKLAILYWNEQFEAQETLQREQEQQIKSHRRQNETLYQTSPFEEAKLRDEGWSLDDYRAEDEMPWAIERLNILGLEPIEKCQTQSWVDEHDNYIVYADPRQVGRISFGIWKKPLPKRKPQNTYRYHLGHFYILDSWKNDLLLKYQKRLNDIVSKENQSLNYLK